MSARSAAPYTNYPCDLCGMDEPIEIGCARLYTGDQPVYVCGGCGFVYVRARRSSEEIARVWSEEIYGSVYTAVKIPAMIARQVYVAEFLASHLDIAGKKICDIGAGEGVFLEYLRDKYGIAPHGVEPSPANSARLRRLGIPGYAGTIEQFVASREGGAYRADVVTIMWTLENCMSCVDMLQRAAALLPEGGHIIVATGSRILVPFKKPLFAYLDGAPADSHCFRFSANALRTALARAGFNTVAGNRYLDSDILCVLGEKASASGMIETKKDDPAEVIGFFERWHQDTAHYADEREEYE